MKKEGVFSMFDARQHWKKVRAEWEQAALQIAEDITKIEDDGIRKPLLRIISATTNRKGEFALNHTLEGFAIEAFDLDDEAFDALQAEFGEDFDFVPAHDWLVSCVKNLPAPFVGWAFGPLKVQKLNGVPDEDENLVHFSHNRMVYSVAERAVIGVLSHPTPSTPGCKVLRVVN